MHHHHHPVSNLPQRKQRSRVGVYAALMARPTTTLAVRPLFRAPFYSTMPSNSHDGPIEDEDNPSEAITPRLSNTNRKQVSTRPSCSLRYSLSQRPTRRSNNKTKTLDSDATPRWSNTTRFSKKYIVSAPVQSPRSVVCMAWDETAPLPQFQNNNNDNKILVPHLENCVFVGGSSIARING